MVVFTLNGKLRECEEGTTLADLVLELNMDKSVLVAECNLVVISTASFSTTIINVGDVVELIEFVAGG